MRKRKEDKIYKTQVQISLEIDTLSVIERFKEQYKEDDGKEFSNGEIIEILLIQSPIYKEKLDKLKYFLNDF
jgi:hypothetical protein